jgi:hypothetical protein
LPAPDAGCGGSLGARGPAVGRRRWVLVLVLVASHLLCLAVGWLLPWSPLRDAKGPVSLEQTGEVMGKDRMTLGNEAVDFEIFYPRPYVSPPNLTFPNPPDSFQLIEQRPDGFKIKVWQWKRLEQPSTWRAIGGPAAR